MTTETTGDRPSRPGGDPIQERRCWPCTALNLALLAVVALVAGRRRRALGALAAAAGGAAIYARGYLLPYTPQVAPRLVAAAGLEEWFHGGAASGRAPDDAGGGSLAGVPGGTGGDTGRDGDRDGSAGADADGPAPSGEAVAEALVESGALEADREALAPSADFRERWTAAMADLRELDDAALAEATLAASAAAEAWSVTDDGPLTPVPREYVVLSDGSGEVTGETWLSRPVAIAETAAVEALEPYVDDGATRRAAAPAFRAFLESCPDCGAPAVETTTAACCGTTTGADTRPDEVLACPDCDVRLYTFE
ncbi:hypothetical protein BRC94_06525 [Halobacteriales archaeon QS_5_70_17]|nr:MAG: hypothetical protein BRC94_06525 [Halobacteriales archaeon QS_5_70_17]